MFDVGILRRSSQTLVLPSLFLCGVNTTAVMNNTGGEKTPVVLRE